MVMYIMYINGIREFLTRKKKKCGRRNYIFSFFWNSILLLVHVNWFTFRCKRLNFLRPQEEIIKPKGGMQKVEALFYAQVLLGCTFHSVPNASIGDAVSFTGWILNLGGGHCSALARNHPHPTTRNQTSNVITVT